MTAQVPPDATAEELKKIKDDATARLEAYSELTKADAARKAWEASQDPPKQAASEQSAAANAAKEVAAARQAQADAEKAQADAELAAAKAKFGEIPDSGYKGEVEMGTGAGGAEAMLLGAVAVNKIADKLTEVIKKDKPPGLTKLLMYTSQTAPDFQALLAFNAQFDALDYAIEQAKESTKDVAYGPSGLALGVATLGLGLDAINKLLGYFKADYSFQGIEVTSSDSMLLSALAEKLKSEFEIEIPSLFHPSSLANASTVREQMTKLYDAGRDAKERIRWYESKQEALEKELAAKPDDEGLKEELRKVKEAVAIWNTLAERIDAWAKGAAGADEKGNVPLATIIRLAAVKKALDDGAGFAVVQLHKVAGTSFTKKNLWTSLFWFTPFYVMGGAVASLTAFTGKEGRVFASALVPWHGGYHLVTEVQSEVNQAAPKSSSPQSGV